MQIGSRLEAIGAMVPQDAVLADVGTDHAYLPVWLLQRGRIKKAIAGDIAVGPCQAAKNTVAMYGMQEKVEVRQGNGLAVLKPGEADCVTIAGMGGSTIISILEAEAELAAGVKCLVLQPMAGAASLRQWLTKNGWQIADEDLIDDAPHFYEIIRVQRGESPDYTEAEYAVGPVLLRKGHPLLKIQLERQLAQCRKLLSNMEKSLQAKESVRYKQQQELCRALEVLNDEIFGNGK